MIEKGKRGTKTLLSETHRPFVPRTSHLTRILYNLKIYTFNMIIFA